MNKQTKSSVIKKINRFLLKKWDPIGIKNMPEAKDEYESYSPEIYNIIQHSSSHQALFDYLWNLETEHMGLSGNKADTEEFSRFLFNEVKSSSRLKKRKQRRLQ
ncbi:MAG: hypothetical protein KGJ02_08410 [Verrucomicrobiota bacterium]|nr:hypothetical protein [Verrucomicrobiota bacterium]